MSKRCHAIYYLILVALVLGRWQGGGMPRPVRIEFAGATYPVMRRGNFGQRLFKDDKDRTAFVGLGLERFNARAAKKAGQSTFSQSEFERGKVWGMVLAANMGFQDHSRVSFSATDHDCDWKRSFQFNSNHKKWPDPVSVSEMIKANICHSICA